MHSSATLLLHTLSPIPSLKTTSLSIIKHPLPAKPFFSQQKNTRNFSNFSASRASGSSQYSPITEFNLYELLGVDASSERAQIKEAYRALQKKCHPDIAGPAGHDMAIVLNEAYALLSDPHSRSAYDKELAKVADLQGYTGRPIYSVWKGSESEQRAVFVDEVKCVGCLKCALFAAKTFAVESVYGRARVVAQWADPEHKIQEAIASCPVDCISTVERSNLAALEFIMSKQPRGRVRVGAGNTVGARTTDIFDEVEKFQARYAKHKASTNKFKESEADIASRISAIQAIQMISNWLYWQSPTTDGSPPATQTSQHGSRKHHGPSLKKLKAAAEARKQATATSGRDKLSSNMNEYWVPSALVLPEATTLSSGSKQESKPRVYPSATRETDRPRNDEFLNPNEDSGNPTRWGVPMGTAFVAATVVRLQLAGEPVGGLKEHIGGSMLLAIVNSSWLQVILAGVTWYLIGMYVVELVEILRRK
ncbi:Molecular chaperone (DnaJ superfamily) [Handroanthus impetiginosus]|uniref:Molecular chaperone (DnaJ superfamily) n=1 Tax=Handroanthus impetiginosus TaxID=429701 RepID=A0A2G9HE78_9LAMI|nr:Molecular chaperone (DnaJ superfamily) [Handroanthus impetiginosus]